MTKVTPEEARAHGNHVAMAGELVNVVADYLRAEKDSPVEDQRLAKVRDVLETYTAIGPGAVESICFVLASMVVHSGDPARLQHYVDEEFRLAKLIMSGEDHAD